MNRAYTLILKDITEMYAFFFKNIEMAQSFASEIYKNKQLSPSH